MGGPSWRGYREKTREHPSGGPDRSPQGGKNGLGDASWETVQSIAKRSSGLDREQTYLVDPKTGTVVRAYQGGVGYCWLPSKGLAGLDVVHNHMRKGAATWGGSLSFSDVENTVLNGGSSSVTAICNEGTYTLRPGTRANYAKMRKVVADHRERIGRELLLKGHEMKFKGASRDLVFKEQGDILETFWKKHAKACGFEYSKTPAPGYKPPESTLNPERAKRVFNEYKGKTRYWEAIAEAKAAAEAEGKTRTRTRPGMRSKGAKKSPDRKPR